MEKYPALNAVYRRSESGGGKWEYKKSFPAEWVISYKDLKFKIKRLYEKIREILKDREKTIIELRFGLNGDKPKTQKQIAKMMGISRSYVSRIETKAIGKLAKELKE